MIITNAGSSIILVYSVIGKQLFFTKKPELNQTKEQNIRSFLYYNNTESCESEQMPSPSASSKFILSVLKLLGILKFLSYTQNILGVLK